MPFYKLLRTYMFPVPMTKTIRNVLEILAGDWKYTGTLNSSFATLSSGLEFANKNIMYILVTQLCMYKKIFLSFLHLAEGCDGYGKASSGIGSKWNALWKYSHLWQHSILTQM